MHRSCSMSALSQMHPLGLSECRRHRQQQTPAFPRRHLRAVAVERGQELEEGIALEKLLLVASLPVLAEGLAHQMDFQRMLVLPPRLDADSAVLCFEKPGRERSRNHSQFPALRTYPHEYKSAMRQDPFDATFRSRAILGAYICVYAPFRFVPAKASASISLCRKLSEN